MHIALRLFCFIILGFFLLPSCGLLKKKPKEVSRKKSNIRLSGRVQQVNQEGQFVLIRRYGLWKVGESHVVESRGDGRTASLKPTGEKLGEHVVADINSGDVKVGDAVYIRRLIKIPTEELPLTQPEIKPVDQAVSEVVPTVKIPSSIPVPVVPEPTVLEESVDEL